MQSHQQHHLIHFNWNRELTELYITIALHAFAMGLIGLFVPIYLLDAGYALQQIFLFYIIAFTSYFFAAVPAMKIISRIGLKHSIVFSNAVWILLFGGLYFLPGLKASIPGLFLALPLLYGVYWAFFWLAYHTDFAKNTEEKRRGEEVSTVNILVSLLSVIAPALGAIIITFIGFPLLFVIAAVLIIASALPLFWSQEIFTSFDYRVGEQFVLKNPKTVVGFIGHGGEKSGATGVVWPLFIFTSLATYISVGAITSVALVVGLVGAYIIGKTSDKVSKKKMVKAGSFLHSITWLVKTSIVSLSHFFTVDAISRVTHNLVCIPREAVEFDRASRADIPSAVVAREMSIGLGAVIFFVVLFMLNNLTFGLILGAAFTLLYYIV